MLDPHFALPMTLQGKTVLFVTNNSMKSRVSYAGKFKSLGISAAPVGGLSHWDWSLPGQ